MYDKEAPRLNLRSQSPRQEIAKIGLLARLQKRSVLLGLVGSTIIIAIAIFVLVQPNDDTPVVQGVASSFDTPIGVEQYHDSAIGLFFEYSSDLVLEPLSDKDKQDGFIARLTSQNPPAIVSVRQESGLRAVAALTNTDTLSLLKTNVDRSLPDRYPGFTKISGESFSDDTQRGFKRLFTYTGPSGEQVKQELLVHIQNDDTAVYVSTQATAALYDSVATDFFDHIQSTFRVE